MDIKINKNTVDLISTNTIDIPQGHVCLGLGNTFKTTDSKFKGKAYDLHSENHNSGNYYMGDGRGYLYFAPYDSEIAKLNDLGKWDKTKLPPLPEAPDGYELEDCGWGGLKDESNYYVGGYGSPWSKSESHYDANGFLEYYYLKIVKKEPDNKEILDQISKLEEEVERLRGIAENSK